MKNTIFIIMLGVFLNSCINHKNSEIREQILNNCSDKNNCLIEIAKIMKFEWTEMYVFRYNVTNEEIQKAIGVDYPYYKEFTDRIVFLKGKEIIYHEDNETNIEGIDDGDLIFNFSDSLRFVSYTPEEAVFNLHIIEGSNGVYYEMIKR